MRPKTKLIKLEFFIFLQKKKISSATLKNEVLMKKIILIIGLGLTFYSYAEVNLAHYNKGAWSPYLVGGLIGVLTLLTLTFSQKPIGASSAYATLAGMIGKLLAPGHTMKLKYFAENPPRFDWGFVFVLAVIIGSFLAAFTGGEFIVRWTPQLWADTFGENSMASYGALSFIGGVLMSFGARLAGGCTSGHGISGALQLSLASWIALSCFFIGGAIVVRFIF
jgi:uncharacterized protein